MENRRKQEKGITLIALVITIIVMLILVGVTVRTAVNSGLFGHAGDATKKWADSEKNELKLGEGQVTVDGITYNSIGDYLESIGIMQQSDGVDVWDGTSSEVPKFKEFNWYIYNCNQFKFFADFVNNGNTLTEDQKLLVAEEGYKEEDIKIGTDTIVYLMINLDLGARQEEGQLTEGTAWTPIGGTNAFEGTFTGNNHYITGVYVNQEANFAALFGNANIVNNLIIKDSYIEGGNCMGGICGKANSMENCHNVNTTVKQKSGSYNTVGGIVGQIASSIKKCTNSGTISSEGISKYINCGGVAGQDSSTGSVTVDACINTGSVTGKGISVAGIIGYYRTKSLISNCTNSGSIKSTEGYVGGIAGFMHGSIENCKNLSSIEGGIHSAGIVASLHDGSISNCTVEGKITSEYFAGGVVCDFYRNRHHKLYKPC